MRSRSLPELPPGRQLQLARPDLSAKEAIAIVLTVLREGGIDVVPVDLRLQGAGDPHGRLCIGNGKWDFLFWWEKQRQCVGAYIFDNGNFAAEYVSKPFWQPLPPPLGSWVDSTVAAEVVSREPMLPGFEGNYVLHLSLVRARSRRLWQASRIGWNAATSTARTHDFFLDFETAALVGERFKQQTGAKIVESWERARDKNQENLRR